MTVVNIEYKGSVSTPAGWRSVYYKGTAEKISEKRVKIIEINEIDDEPVNRNMSRTGAKRQQYNGVYFADAEKGKVKNISSLYKISE
jgi:hypothetical protein